jgi:thiol-disulfide isomerase/thioredoxin
MITRRDSAGALLRRTAVAAAVCLSCSAGNAQVPQEIRDVPVREAAGMVGQYRGNVVMFHLYASWCGPCVKELPDINRLGTAFGGQGFALLAFSVDEDRDLLSKFLGNNPLSFLPMRISHFEKGELVSAIRSIGGTYQAAIPYTAIYDRSGRLVREWSGGNTFETYRSVIQPLLSAEVPKGSSTVQAAGAPVSSGLNFTLAEHRVFKIAQKKPNLCLLTMNGKVPAEATSEPYFLAGSVYARSPIPDRRKFTEERLRSTGAVSGVTIRETRDLKVGDLGGYECIAEAKDTDLNAPIVIYHAILFADNRYYLMQGFSPPQERDQNLHAFREIVSTFRR